MKAYIYPLALTLLLSACRNSEKREENGAFAKEKADSTESVDFSQIKETGELIVTTLSGPDTYYDYQGVPLGREYSLISNFAVSEGLRLRIEVAHDTTEMLQMLVSGNADIAVFPLPQKMVEAEGLQATGAQDAKKHTAWAVRSESRELSEALELWWQGGKVLETLHTKQIPTGSMLVRRHVYAPFISREKGQISTYDPLFQEAARAIGWDWRLIAAQAYQESAFDPQAVSWAGARGLMQLMPATATAMGVSNVHDPRENVMGGARYLRLLGSQFSDIPNGEERLRFVLAAYNGGSGHIRDAMALAKKYGKQSTSWGDVSMFVLGLQQPRYYRDPVVKYGYMIGSQTYEYVNAIMERYRTYGGAVSATPNAMPLDGTSTTGTPPKTGRHKIYMPEDLEKMEE